MQLNKIRFMLNIVLSIGQFGIIAAVFILEKYATEKMGVARFLTYKKQWFENTMFTTSFQNLYLFFFILGTIICLGFLVFKLKRKEKPVSLLVAIVANVVAVVLMQFNFVLAAYHFFIVAIMIVIAIQYVKIFLTQ